MELNTLSRVCSPTPYRTETHHTIGIAYQLTEADPLIDTAQCQRDASMMAQLGANAIRDTMLILTETTLVVCLPSQLLASICS